MLKLDPKERISARQLLNTALMMKYEKKFEKFQTAFKLYISKIKTIEMESKN